MHHLSRRTATAILLLMLCRSFTSIADDWPTYRHDNRRSGACGDPILPPLSQSWVFRPLAGPEKAWGDPQPQPIENVLELPRMGFDQTFHVAAAGERVYFGSSSDCKVYALDAVNGTILWEFYTEGPVRIAPTAHNGLVYAGSDDGRVYCIDADRGRLVWDFLAAPSPRRVLGNGKLISLWPVRTGVLIDAGTAYFGAGIFPAEGVYLYAVNASDGRLVWRNNDYGRGGMGTVSPQGCMLASARTLFVPSGRTMPAAFNRQNGRFLYHANFNWGCDGLFGGVYNVLGEDVFFGANEQLVCARQDNGALVRTEGLRPDIPGKGSRRLSIDDGTMFYLDGEHLTAASLAEWQAGSPAAVLWRTPCGNTGAIAVTRDNVFVGGKEVLRAFDRKTGKETWSAAVDGLVLGLAVAQRRLFASTDRGNIHCFIEGSSDARREIKPAVAANPFQRDGLTAAYPETAEELLRVAGVTQGYALILGGDGRLALELVRRTRLTIYVVNPDEKIVARARDGLTQAGVYGSRVAVFRHDLASLPYSDYFADLVICHTTAEAGVPTPADEVLRVLRPRGGTACVGSILAASTVANWKDGPSLKNWLEDLARAVSSRDEFGTQVSVDGNRARVVRGPLPGAAGWSHQYAEPGNTACSGDKRIRGALGVLWFGGPGAERIPSRHASAASPLVVNGRMFVQGENVIMAYDVYNGRKLWEREIAGAVRLGVKGGAPGNLAADDTSVFVAVGDRCLRLDAAGGETLAAYSVPESDSKAVWNYLACVDGMLYGSAVSALPYPPGDNKIFALDPRNGKTDWVRQAEAIVPSTICIADGRIFYVERSATDEQRNQCLAEMKTPPEIVVDHEGTPVPPDIRLVVCLNTRNGKVRWSKPVYVGDCVQVGPAGGELTALVKEDVLLLCGQPWNGHFWQEFLSGGFSRRSIIALRARNGRELWSGHKGYRSRPLIVGSKIIAEPWAHDLATGAEIMRTNAVTGTSAKWQIARPGHHCGNMAASAHMLFGRSDTTAYYDLEADFGTVHFGAQRPGCWINCVPADGVVAMPEASSGCVCPYSIQGTTVFYPRPEKVAWGVYSADGGNQPVKRLALNFGAPGDRKDSDGNLWLAYPRPFSGRLVMDAPVEFKPSENASFICGDADFTTIHGTPDSWIYVSGWLGVTNFAVKVHDDPLSAGQYTVRLHFAESGGFDEAGARVFHVRISGRELLDNFDIFNETGAANAALVREFKNVRAMGSMRFELTPVRGMPLLAGLEIVREFAPPAVTNSSVIVVENKTALISLPVTFPDGAPMFVQPRIIAGPAPGALEHRFGRHFRYIPATHYIGEDSFTWRVTDGVTQTREVKTVISVIRDVDPPLVESVRGTGLADELIVVFDEPVAPETAATPANYKLSPAIAVRGARLLEDRRSVLLNTDPMPETSLVLSIAGITDRARKPNACDAVSVGYKHSLAGYILYEAWTDVKGLKVENLMGHADFPDRPDRVMRIERFSAPADRGDNYGARIRGYLKPPATGNYTFWISSDDNGELWLSSSRHAEHKALIASVPERTAPEQWDRYPEQKSDPVHLEAGRIYYIEALMKEGAGGDNLAVAWAGPGINRQVIPGACLLLPDDARRRLREP